MMATWVRMVLSPDGLESFWQPLLAHTLISHNAILAINSIA